MNININSSLPSFFLLMFVLKKVKLVKCPISCHKIISHSFASVTIEQITITCNSFNPQRDVNVSWSFSDFCCFSYEIRLNFLRFPWSPAVKIPHKRTKPECIPLNRLSTNLCGFLFLNSDPCFWPDIIWYFTMVNQRLFTVVILMTAYVSNINAFLGIGGIVEKTKVSMNSMLLMPFMYTFVESLFL